MKKLTHLFLGMMLFVMGVSAFSNTHEGTSANTDKSEFTLLDNNPILSNVNDESPPGIKGNVVQGAVIQGRQYTPGKDAQDGRFKIDKMIVQSGNTKNAANMKSFITAGIIEKRKPDKQMVQKKEYTSNIITGGTNHPQIVTQPFFHKSEYSGVTLIAKKFSHDRQILLE